MHSICRKGIIAYVVDTDRTLEDGKILHQTWYYPMDVGASVVIYATDFSDTIAPDVYEAAKHIVATLKAL